MEARLRAEALRAIPSFAEYDDELGDALYATFLEKASGCQRPEAGAERLRLLLRIDADGHIAEARLHPETPAGVCVRDVLLNAKATMPLPISDNWWTSFGVTIQGPRTATRIDVPMGDALPDFDSAEREALAAQSFVGTARYETALLDVVYLPLGNAVQDCSDPRGNPPYSLVLHIARDGTVDDVAVSPDVTVGRCVRKRLIDAKHRGPKPPKAGWWARMKARDSDP